MTKFRFFIGAIVFLVFSGELRAQCCGGVIADTQAYMVQYGSVCCEPAAPPAQTYKKVYDIEYREEEVVTYKTEWETSYRTTTVAKQVPETDYYQEKFKLLKPVWTVEYRDESYDVTRYVPETSEREEKYTVSKPVFKIENREILETVRTPIKQTVMQEKRYIVQKPSTTFQTRTVDKGEFVDSIQEEPGKTYNKLTWQNGGSYYDPETGTTKRRLPGLYWTPLTSEPKYHVQKVYKPNFITEQFPVTTYTPETVVEQIPVEITTFQEEQVRKIEPVQIQEMVQEEVVRKIPVITHKPVVERVEKIVPINVCKMQEEEMIREIPRTTYKTVTEEKVVEVKVPRQVREVKKVVKPITIERWVPITSGTPSPASIAATKPVVSRLGIDSGAMGSALPQPDRSNQTTFAAEERHDAKKHDTISTEDDPLDDPLLPRVPRENDM